MAKYNKAKFRSTTLYTEDYLELDSLRRSPMDPIAAVLHRLLEEMKSEILSLRQTILKRGQTVLSSRRVIYRPPPTAIQMGRAQGRWR